MNRSLKQLLYSLIYLVFLVFIGIVVWGFFSKQPPTCTDGKRNQNETGIDCGGTCVSCDLKDIQPVEFLGYSVMPLKSGRVSLLVHVKNPNETHHASPFSYTIRLFDENDIEREVFYGDASLVAGSDGYILENKTTYSDPKRVEFEMGDANWKLKESFLAPELVIQETSTTVDKNVVRVKGTIENKSSFGVENIHIIAILGGEYNEDVFASEMILTRMAAFRKEQFSVAFPSDPEIAQRLKTNATRVIVQAE
ncbi:MAG: Uncharacterized protein LiPW41_251 [Parcubacteria group bacterium LiPW_41]|nr:MAG: Uncharacterized protein LiPW41_251 [Parcubacteria group bacterium LiPW_41]